MPLSYQSITNPSSTSFTVSFEFLNLADIKAVGKLNSASEWTELPVTDAATSNGVTTVTVADAGTYSSAGEVRIYRASSQAALVDFQNGSRLSESDLDTAYRQGLFAAQEVRENAADSITAVGPQGPAGADGQDGADGVDGADGTSASNTPNFHANKSNTTIPNNVGEEVIYSTKAWDTANLYSNTTGKFTVGDTTTGYYYIYAGVKFNQLGADRIQLRLKYYNGTSTITFALTEMQMANNGYAAPHIATLVPLVNSGDYVCIEAYQTSGSSKNLSNEVEGNYFGGFKLA
jgi:hypothetical protein